MKRAIPKIILLAVFILGLAGWIISLSENPTRPYAAVLVNFTFFVPLAAGLVVWPSIVIASNGNWMGKTERTARAAVVFSVPSVVVLAILWISSHVWAPWVKVNAGHDMWLNNTFLFVRDLVLLILFWILAVYSLKGRDLTHAKFIAGLLSFFYCVVFTFLGFDLVMALQPDWRSNLFGAYFFISGLYIAITAWTFLSLIYKSYDESKIMDLGKLILAFCLMTTYMMYSQLLPLWYENIPDQTIFIRKRTNFSPWSTISLIVSVTVYVSPLVLLFTKWAKKTPWFLALVSIVLLSGLWMERWWLVSVQFESTALFGLPEIVTILLFAGLFGFGYEWFYRSNYLSYLEKADNG